MDSTGKRFHLNRDGEGELFRPTAVPHAGRLAQRLLRLESSVAITQEPIRHCSRRRTHEIHNRSREVYGTPRVHTELRATGIRCCRNQVARLIRQEGTNGCLRGSKKHSTRWDGSALPAPGLGPSGLRRCSARQTVGCGHHLHPYRGGLPVSSFRAGCLSHR